MFDSLRKMIISNNWKFPEEEVKQWNAYSGNVNKTISSGIVSTKHFGKLYFYIISPWEFCPNGEIIIENAR